MSKQQKEEVIHNVGNFFPGKWLHKERKTKALSRYTMIKVQQWWKNAIVDTIWVQYTMPWSSIHFHLQGCQLEYHQGPCSTGIRASRMICWLEIFLSLVEVWIYYLEIIAVLLNMPTGLIFLHSTNISIGRLMPQFIIKNRIKKNDMVRRKGCYKKQRSNRNLLEMLEN